MSTFPIPLSPSFSFLLSSFFPLARISIWFETCSPNLLLSVPPLLFQLLSQLSFLLPLPPSFQTRADCLAVWEERSQLSRRGEEPKLDPGAGWAYYTLVTQWLNKYWEK